MDEDNVVVVGLISDTHGVVEEAALQALKRTTNTIIHAGDVGDKNHKRRLSAEQIIAHLQRGTNKSIVAVSGNVDEGHADLPHSVSLTIHGKNILVEHICGFPPRKELEERVIASCTDIVVFGHSHVPGVWWHNNVLYVNPGSAGPRRFKLPRCIAFLMIHSTGDVEVEFTPIDSLPQDTIGLPSSFKISTMFHDKSDERKEVSCCYVDSSCPPVPWLLEIIVRLFHLGFVQDFKRTIVWTCTTSKWHDIGFFGKRDAPALICN